MNPLTDYKPWTNIKTLVELECGCIIKLPVVAAIDRQAVIDTITITSYLVHSKLPCGGRME